MNGTMPIDLEEPREADYIGDTRTGGRLLPYPNVANVQHPVQRPGSSSMAILMPPQPRPIQEVDGGAIGEPDRLPPQYQDLARVSDAPNRPLPQTPLPIPPVK
jgi:hypothetical protein